MPTFAGINPNFEIDRYPPEIRAALRRISDDFYVSRSFLPETISNSQYFAALVRPTDETSVFLNTERELMVVFTRYETFEIRTLEAYDVFFEKVGSARVDQTIRFLVSNDDAIEKHISHYLAQHPEYPIIVPVTFDTLQKRVNPLIRSVQKNYMIRDLFGFQSPLREEHFFFGRSEIVGNVIDLARSGQHSSLFGLRKSGKTSSIYAVQRKSHSTDLLVVTVDCQDLAVHGRRYGELLSWLVSLIRSATNSKAIKLPTSMYGPAISEWFNAAMTTTLSNSKSHILLIFDEVENISPNTAASPHWRSGEDALLFWQIVRSFCQKQGKRNLAICFVGTSPYLLEAPKINDVDNPAYLLANKRFIPNLTFDETREMIDRLGFFMGLRFPAKAVAALHASYGGHPFFTRQVCSKIHQLTGLSRPTEVPMARVQEAQRQFLGQLETYLSDIISNLKTAYPAEFQLLRSLVLGERDEIDDYLKEAPELIDHLIGYGLIVARDGVYEIAFDAAKAAVLKLEPVQMDAAGNDERWSSLGIRRNNLEQALRSALFLWSKSVDPDTWTSVLTRALSVQRNESLVSREPSYVLAKGSSPLYLSDIIGFLKDERVFPYLRARRSGILKALNTVNVLRLDAHAADVTDRDFENVMNASLLLEQEFLVP